MGMSQFYGFADDKQSLETIQAALDLGVNFLDTADFYGAGNALTGAMSPGFGHNEELIGRAIKGRRKEVVIATKFGVQLNQVGTGFTLNGDPKYVASACEASLRRLNVEMIDLYYAHRVDPNIPVEETVGAMARLVEEGKVHSIGLSDATSSQLRRAHAVYPVSALQSEYSLWERNVEKKILPACHELGVTFVPYCPLGRSMLTGAVNQDTRFSQGDYRAIDLRFGQDNVVANMRPVESLVMMAKHRQMTPAQLALAWLLAQPFAIVPIPGTKQIKYLRENAAATDFSLSQEEVSYLNEIFNPAIISGKRETTL
jgi:aryl-alcohol dehydrogenase-like predicted oxidoreductase